MFGLLELLNWSFPPEPCFYQYCFPRFPYNLPYTLLAGAWFLLCCGVLYLAFWTSATAAVSVCGGCACPFETGSWSRMLQLGRPRMEYICPYGHGTLKEPELQISGRENSEWTKHAEYWEELCARGLRMRTPSGECAEMANGRRSARTGRAGAVRRCVDCPYTTAASSSSDSCQPRHSVSRIRQDRTTCCANGCWTRLLLSTCRLRPPTCISKGRPKDCRSRCGTPFVWICPATPSTCIFIPALEGRLSFVGSAEDLPNEPGMRQ